MLSFLPIVLSVIALSLGAPGGIHCKTFSFTDENNSDNTVYVGIFGYRSKSALFVEDFDGDTDVYIRTYCAPYDDLTDYFGFEYDVDTKWTATKAFAIIGVTLGGILSIISCIVPCVSPPSTKHWKLLGFGFLLVCLFQGLSLLSLSSDVCTDNPVINALERSENKITGLQRFNFPEKCEWASGYKLNISSVVFWFLAALSVLLLPAPEKYPTDDPFETPQQQEAAYDAKVAAEETGFEAEKVDAEETAVEAEEINAEETAVEVAK
jgi:hypothetical protein